MLMYHPLATDNTTLLQGLFKAVSIASKAARIVEIWRPLAEAAIPLLPLNLHCNRVVELTFLLGQKKATQDSTTLCSKAMQTLLQGS